MIRVEFIRFLIVRVGNLTGKNFSPTIPIFQFTHPENGIENRLRDFVIRSFNLRVQIDRYVTKSRHVKK